MNYQKVTDIILLQNLKSSILGFWPKRKNHEFPAPLPVSIERKNFEALRKFSYVISLKSNGTRFLLMLYNKKAYLVDRIFDFYEVSQNFADNIYGSSKDGCGALFDGELMKMSVNSSSVNSSPLDSSSVNSSPVNAPTKYKYYIHDCSCIFSTDISSEIFTDRYDSIKTALALWSQENSDFEICAKVFYNFKDITEELITNADHDIDGLIFTPVDKGIGNGTQRTLFKWKYKHTFDFMIVEENNEYVSYVLENKMPKKYASVKKRNAKFNRLL